MRTARFHRRSFLARAATGAASLCVLPTSQSAWSYALNDKVQVALVGVGGRGRWFVDTIPRLETVVAMCDVNERRAAASFAKLPDVPRYDDFRKMLDDMGGQIDAVVVATPDNTHAVITSTAMRHGKHVYCEKPLTHHIHEARTLRKRAREHGVATQMGNQGTASEAFRRALEIVGAGVLGDVRDVHAWNTGGGIGERQPPEGEQPVPAHLKWDLWLGPARQRPYHADWMRWHGWRDFATGQLGNWASHTMNLAFKALKIDRLWTDGGAGDDGEPSARCIRVQASVSGRHTHTFPRWELIRYDVPVRGPLPPLRVNWYNGAGGIPEGRERIEGLMGRKLDFGDAGERKWNDHAGCLLVGSKGRMHLNAHNTTLALLPADDFRDSEGPPRSVSRSRGHEREWLDACRGGRAAMSNFDYSGPLAEFVLLGNIATRFEDAVNFDPVAMRITNNDTADRALRREYREGWVL